MTEAEVARLYHEYGYVLFRRCLAYLGDEQAAQEAVKDVFVRALGAANAVRDEVDPRTRLCRIADQRCVDQIRRRGQTPAAAQPGRAAQPVADAVDDAPESFAAVRRVLAGLEPENQRLAVLYYLDELTEEELARELNLSRRAAGKRLQNLLDRARALLSQEQSA